jgi:AraC-like DNA-binding protein
MIQNQLAWDDRSKGDKQKTKSAQRAIFIQVMDLLRLEGCHLDSGLRKEQICLRLRTSPSSLLKALKKEGFRNFPHFINHYRVEEAKKMMSQEAFQVYTLEAIADMAGFGTRQGFYNVFERMVGMKPARYRRIVLSKTTHPGNGGSDQDIGR